MSDSGQPTKTLPDFEAALNKADSSVASFEHEHITPLQKLRIFLQAYPVSVPIFVLIISVLLFGITTDGKIFQPSNLSTILKQITPIGIVAIAQTIIILTAGIDLSIGAIMVLSSIIMGKLAVQVGVPAPAAMAIGFPWHALHLPGAQALVLGIGIDPQRRHRSDCTPADLVRQRHLSRRIPDSLRHHSLPASGMAHVICPQAHRLGTPRLCRW
jgi:hypothetical protein